MALEFFEGFDNQWFDPICAFGGSTAWIAGRTGGYALRNFTSTNNSSITVPLTASPKKTAGFAFYVNSYTGAADSAVYFPSISAAGTTHIAIQFDSSGHIIAKRGGTGGTIIATSTQIWIVNQWHYVEVQVTIDDAVGTCIVKVDGVEWINFVGDTRNAGSSVNIDQMAWGFRGQTNLASQFLDDIYICNEVDASATTGRADNTFLGDVKVELLVPNGNGAITNGPWMGSDTNTTDNYALIDEIPANTTDYVGTGTTGQQDFFDITNVTPSVVTVYGVQPVGYVQKSDAGAAGLKYLLRESGGTITPGSEQILSTSWGHLYGSRYMTKPTGGAWTPTDVNALQIGVEKT